VDGWGHHGRLAWKPTALVASAVLLASATWAGSASANADDPFPPAPVDLPDHGPKASASHHRTFGMSMDVGVPDGAALGLVVRPHFDWLRIGAALTHNGIAPGLRLGVTVDPIAFPIAPTFTVEGGHYWQGTVPFVQNATDVGYNYANFHVGLEIGNRSTFRFFIRGGASWLDVNTNNFQSSNAPSGMTGANGGSTSGVGNPTFNGWLAPSGKLGFSLYF
jgi:hypothetical protein